MIKKIKNILIVGFLIHSSAFAQDDSHYWKQPELNESFMREITKDQCMAKTISSLKTGCSSGECLKTLGGITGDCVTWAKGDAELFCVTYVKNYLARYCASNELDARQCIVLHLVQPIYCKTIGSSTKKISHLLQK